MVPRPRWGPPCCDKWRRFDAEAASGLWGKAWSAGDQLKSGDCRVLCCSHVVESRVGVQVNECIWSGDDWRKNANVSGCRKVTIKKMPKCSNADIAEVDSTQLRLCSATGRASLFKTSAGSPHSPCVQRTGWISKYPDQQNAHIFGFIEKTLTQSSKTTDKYQNLENNLWPHTSMYDMNMWRPWPVLPSRRLVAVLNQWKPTAAGHQLIRGGNPSQADTEAAGKPTGGKTQLEGNKPTSSDESNLAPVIQIEPTTSANVTSVCKNAATKSIARCRTNQLENFTDLGTGITSVGDIAQNEKNIVKRSSTTTNCTDTICANWEESRNTPRTEIAFLQPKL